MNVNSSLKKKKGDKQKKADDNVIESAVGAPTQQAEQADGVEGQLPNKKRRRTNKEKNIKDDVTDGTLGDGSKKKRGRKTEEGENEVDDPSTQMNNPATQNKSEIGTDQTPKDFL